MPAATNGTVLRRDRASDQDSSSEIENMETQRKAVGHSFMLKSFEDTSE